MKKFFAYFIASFFGSGFFPIASGTFGSMVSFIAIVPIAYFYGTMGLLVFAWLSFIAGWLSSTVVLKYTEHDPSLIVIDETAGQTISVLFVANFLKGSFNFWWLYIAGFVLFRIFDITKPLIIGTVDKKIQNAFGVMFDDVLAGLFAGICLYLVCVIIY